MKRQSTKRNENGQAMVEFAIMLIIVMAFCVGMCATIRLLTFQFWARQEARFLAFEQVWSADEFYNDSGENPASLLDAGTDIGRPAIVTSRQHTRDTNDDGSVTNLLSWLWKPAPDAADDVPIKKRRDAGSILIAKANVGEMFSWINTAFARQDDLETDTSLSIDDLPAPSPGGPRTHPIPTMPKERLGRGLEGVLERHGFGPRLCTVLENRFRSAGAYAAAAEFSDRDCGRRFNEDFGMYLGENMDFEELFHDYGDRLEWGDAPNDAMQGAIRHSVGNHFYSFFDTLVKSSRTLAAAEEVINGASALSSLSDSSTTRLISDSRYIGSAIAVGAVIAGIAPISTPSYLDSTDADSVLNTEKDFIINVLHVDASSELGGTGYFLSPLYLPVPPTFGATAPALQEAAMKNVLFEDSSLSTRFIDDSNKKIQVTYKAEGGLFPAATKGISGIEDVQLTSNYYIIGQPWHITRRISSSGDYRQKGTETDDIDNNSEEGVLRRRVSGLWLFPSDITAFLQPIAALPGLGSLGPVFSAFSPIGSLIGQVKHFVLVDNPIFKILDALHSLPGIGSIIPTAPQWPAVRPDAYVGSEEMTGDDTSKKDNLMGSDRNFSDYITEQRNFNPPPNPTFN